MIECLYCHLDTPEDMQEDGVCLSCLDTFEHDQKYATEFQRIHGIDWERE